MADAGAGAKGFGGRNRLRSLEDTSGSAPKPPAGKATGVSLPPTGPQTHAGFHDPKSITSTAMLPAQNTLQDAGEQGPNTPGGNDARTVDLGHKIPTQRSMYPSPDNKGAGSESQGPEGDFGGAPGQAPDVPSISYP